MSHSLDTMLKLGYEARRESRTADARAHFKEAVEIARQSGDQAHLARALVGLGQIERDLHQLDAAVQCYEESVRILRALDDPLRLAHTVRHQANILRNMRQLARALPCYEEALAIYRRHEQTPPLDLANALRGFALLQAEMGAADTAKQLWQEAGTLYAQAGVQAGVDESRAQIARLTAK